MLNTDRFDIASDLDFDDDLGVPEIAKPRFVSAKQAPGQYKSACGRCGGSGVVRPWGTCFACNGVGYKMLKTSPEVRAKARAKAAERREEAAARVLAEKVAKAQAWRDANPAATAWIAANAGRFDFATSMEEAVSKWGGLTAGQLAAVERCIARDAERAAARAAAPAPTEFRVSKLFSVLQRHSKFYAGDLTITRKNGESLCWVLWQGECVGKIENEVVVIFARRIGEHRAQVEALLAEFEADPLAAAVKYGKLSGRCCSCGRDLTNPASIDAGIGPICAEKF